MIKKAYNPRTKKYVYYKILANGKAKIVSHR